MHRRHDSILHRLILGLVAAGAALPCPAGCTTAPREYFESPKGQGFPGWSERMASGARRTAPDAGASGFFTDRRSEQIEEDLGGGF